MNEGGVLPGLAAVHAELRALTDLARAAGKGSPALLAWLAGRERRLAQFERDVSRTPDDARLVSEWLSHAPPLTVTAGPLARRVAVFERHLFDLAGTLMQHSDGVWARELYRDLLDHAYGERT